MNITFQARVAQFPGKGGWVYISVPTEYTNFLKTERKAWGMYPIRATIGDYSWSTKLMMKKGGSFFIALKQEVRKKLKVEVGITITVSFSLPVW